MFTIYTTCRSFDHPKFGLIQRNAIGSWLQLQPRPEIIIVGNDPGVSEICKEQNLIHIPEVETRENNCPVLSDMAKRAESISNTNTMLLISSDMIIFQDSVDASNRLEKQFKRFCAGLHRKDRDIDHLIDFSNINWIGDAKQFVKLGHPGAGDYFLYTKGIFYDMPPFTIGRASCDNWMYWKAYELKCLVNITPIVEVVHQNHDQSHMVGGGIFNNPEFKVNRNLAGNRMKVIADANYTLQ